MSKQTAFQWYMQEYNKLADLCDTMAFDERFRRFDELIQQTKAMEKEQIQNAHIEGQSCVHYPITELAEEFYNETYGGN